MKRQAWRRGAVIVALALVVWLTVRTVGASWGEFVAAAGSLRPRAGLVAISAALVLAIYAVQIHAWRTLASAWGTRLPFWTAARVWSLSNLTRFAPASFVVTTGAMGLLGRQAGIPAVAAAGAALLGTLLSLATGAVVSVAIGAQQIERIAPQVPRGLTVVIAVLAVVAVLALPAILAPFARLASRIARRPVTLPPLPTRALATAVASNVAAWLLYGAAFWALILAFFPDARGGWILATAIFTVSYLLGWLTLLTPGGVGFRELFLTIGLTKLGVLPAADALVVVVASRLLLSILEVLPGAAFLVRDALSRPSSPPDAAH